MPAEELHKIHFNTFSKTLKAQLCFKSDLIFYVSRIKSSINFIRKYLSCQNLITINDWLRYYSAINCEILFIKLNYEYGINKPMNAEKSLQNLSHYQSACMSCSNESGLWKPVIDENFHTLFCVHVHITELPHPFFVAVLLNVGKILYITLHYTVFLLFSVFHSTELHSRFDPTLATAFDQ